MTAAHTAPNDHGTVWALVLDCAEGLWPSGGCGGPDTLAGLSGDVPPGGNDDVCEGNAGADTIVNCETTTQ